MEAMDNSFSSESILEGVIGTQASSWHPAWRPDSDRDIHEPTEANDQTSFTPAQSSPHLLVEDPSLPRNISSASLQPHSFHVEDVEDIDEKLEQPGPNVHDSSYAETPSPETLKAPENEQRSHDQSFEQNHVVVPEAEIFPSIEPDPERHTAADEEAVKHVTDIGSPPIQIEEATAGPSHRDSHASSTSFARTVSHEVIVGEDDEISPKGWELPRRDTDIFKQFEAPDRSNSFPEVPLPKSPDLIAETFSTQPGAESGTHIAESYGPSEGSDVPFGDYTAPADTSNTSNTVEKHEVMGPLQSATEESWPNPATTEQLDGLNLADGWGPDSTAENEWMQQDPFNGLEKIQGTQISEPTDAGVRFEEGLPLIPPEPSQELSDPEEKQQQQEPDFFSNSNDDGHDFFASTLESSKNDDDFKPAHIQRKSTTQVLDSLQYPPHNETHPDESAKLVSQTSESLENIAEPSDAQDQPNSLEQGDAGASSPVVEAEKPANSMQKSKEEALTEMWASALEDDELLEDDFLDETENKETEKTVDPAAFFEDDGEGFLDDEPSRGAQPTYTNDLQPPQNNVQTSSNFEQRGNPYFPNKIESHSVMAGNTPNAASWGPSQTWSGGFAPVAPNASSATDIHGSRPPMSAKAQSFADKAKGGYSSPYDLPGDVLRPKKRPVTHQVVTAPSSQPTPPPPRSSSMHPFGVGGPSQLPPPPNRAVSSFVPQAHPPPPSNGTPEGLPTLKPKPSTSSFFEEIPLVPRSRPSTNAGRITPQPKSTTPPLPGSTFAPPVPSPPPMQELPPQSQTGGEFGLLPAERVNPYATIASSPPVSSSPPTTAPVSSRYSPAPPPTGGVIKNQSRYAQPPAQAHNVLPFQPRTSSPLASHERPQSQRVVPQQLSAAPTTSYASRSVSESIHSREAAPNNIIGGMATKRASFDKGPPPLRSVSHALPPTSSRYAPHTPALSQAIPALPTLPSSPPQIAQSADGPFPAPRRSQTQSPGTASFGPTMPMATIDTRQRPASVNDSKSPAVVNPYSSPISRHGRTLSETTNYVFPTDGRETDPLQRWKGYPIFSWGFGGSIVTSFPKQVPRFAAGQIKPMIKCTPGEVIVRGAKEVCPLPDRFAKFPGPLKGKSKKKEIVSWLTDVIKSFEETSASDSMGDPTLQQHEERILLWKILRSFIENDGALEGNPSIDGDVRSLLLPDDEADASEASEKAQAINSPISSMTASANPTARTEPIDPQAVEQLRKFLIKGKREDAVWHAVDKRLWAHAMLIASTLSKEIWKQVVQEFVRQEVKNLSDKTEPLASLYDVFAGNWEESIDELVPPSARAGFQLIRTDTASGPTKNALEGLNKWRESASLILSNRNPGDEQALLALARLLSSYHRTDAAHICFMFARSVAPFGGAEDPHACISLLSADHRDRPFDFARDLDSILLSEVYEYGLSLSATSASTTAPHLQAYKLYHAILLAEAGYRTDAQSYCDAIAAAMKATTKHSPYYHALFLSSLDDLSKRLSRTPKDSSSSWISKPSMEKVSGSVWASFNRFVAGDEDDEASGKAGQAGGAEVGPFARIAGNTPSVSRPASNINLSTTYSGAPQAQSKYSPVGPYAPQMVQPQTRPLPEQPMALPYQPIRASSEITAGPYGAERATSGGFEPQPLLHHNYQPRAPSNQYQPVIQTPEAPNVLQTSSPVSSQNAYIPMVPAESEPLSSPPQAESYEPRISSDYLPPSQSYEPSVPKTSYEPVELTFGDVDGNVRQHEMEQAATSYQPPSGSAFEEPLVTSQETGVNSGYEPPVSSNFYEPPASSSYEPPASNSYEPPAGDATASFEEQYSAKDDEVEEKKPKKSIMDDDEDDAAFAAKAAAILNNDRAKRDKANEEAFRKAAEADAARDSKPQEKKGWFGSWFSKGGGGNEGGGPIKAKLGEENSFYYDPELKKWVNKKGGAQTPTPSATPPPPRGGPPSRSASAAQAATPPPPVSSLGGLRPPLPGSTQSLPVPTLGPPSGPPSSLPNSRPPSRSPSSNFGLVPGGPGGPDSPLSAPPAPPLSSAATPGPPSGPPSRPATSMSEASSIDDLLGVPAPRKGGTLRKPKKGGRYIDVMAK